MRSGLVYCKIDDVHDRVLAVGLGEFADEVDTDDVPRCVGNGQGVKFAVGFMARRLGATAQIAGLGIKTYMSAQARPPIVARNQFEGLEPSRVSRDARIVMLLENPTSKVFVVRDIDLAAI